VVRLFRTEAAKGLKHCAKNSNHNKKVKAQGRVIVTRLDRFYARANDIPNVPQGWPLVEFCASHAGEVSFEMIPLLAGLDAIFPDGGNGHVLFSVNVSEGWNAVVLPAAPAPVGNPGLLTVFYQVVTTDTLSLRPAVTAVHYRLVTPGDARPSIPLPHVLTPADALPPITPAEAEAAAAADPATDVPEDGAVQAVELDTAS
jgi:hypothetical protein